MPHVFRNASSSAMQDWAEIFVRKVQVRSKTATSIATWLKNGRKKYIPETSVSTNVYRVYRMVGVSGVEPETSCM